MTSGYEGFAIRSGKEGLYRLVGTERADGDGRSGSPPLFVS